MAWREARGAWRQFAAAFASVALGVAAVVAVGTFAANLDRTLVREGRALLGGDLEVQSARPLGPDAEAALEALRRQGAALARVRELAGMARGPGGTTALVALKAVDEGYPLYGALETEPRAPGGALLAGGGAVVAEDLLSRLALRVGDRLEIGSAPFRIAGVVRREPDRPASLLALGPRVLIASEDLERTGLLQFGSRVRGRALVRLPAGADASTTREALARTIADPGVQITSFDEAQPGLRRFFTQLATYLGLVGLASLLLGGIGVATAVATYVRRQFETIATLKVLGAGSRELLGIYFVQTQVVGVAAGLVGAALGSAIQPALVRVAAGFVPLALDPVPHPWTLLRGLAMGALTSLLCALWPLLEVHEVPPSLILRRDVDVERWPARRPWAAGLPIAAGLAGLALWQAGSLKAGGIFLAASLGAVILLLGLARAIVFLARALPRAPWMAWRQGMAGLRRPGGDTGRVVLALGTGVMLLMAVALLQANLGRQIDHERRRLIPSFFFLDVQPDQREGFERMVAARAGGEPPEVAPVVRARLAAVNGERITRELIERRRAEGREGLWHFTREYVLTYREDPPPGNEIIRGRWWAPQEVAGRPRASVEETAARRLGVDVGSTLIFDVQGVPVEAEVMSLRRVDWQTFGTNFFVVLSPGALEGAPATFIATARVPAAAEGALRDAVVGAFPNVTAIPVREVLAGVAAVLDRIALGVRAIALFAIGTGLVVMAGVLAATRRQRLYESVIFRALGATRGAVARAFAVEYACLGAAAGAGGTTLAAVLSWIVLRYVLDTPWTFEPGPILLGIALTAVLALAVGFLATFRLLGHKPLPVLRTE
jgi:putative ABC transport system permease protein